MNTVCEIENKQKMNQIKEQLGETVYLMRKAAKISQVELGRLLSLHQTAICRIEQGLQSLMIEQLYTLSQFFDVKLDALIEGEVDYWKLSQRFNQLPPLPSRYREFPHSKVREVLPGFRFMERHRGEGASLQLMTEMKLPKAYFFNPDLSLGVYCQLDLLKHLIQNGGLNESNVQELVEEARTEQVQGFLHPVFANQCHPLSVIQTWVINAHHYENHFRYEIQDLEKDRLVLFVTPESHMKDVAYRDPVLGDMLCQYKKAYLSQLSQYLVGSSPVHVTEKECHFHGADQCIYEFSTLAVS